MEPLTVIKGWHTSARLQWRLASGFLDRLVPSQTSSAPVVKIQISPAALTVRLDAAAVMIALGLSASFLHFYRFYGYRKLRPQVRLCDVSCTSGTPLTEQRVTAVQRSLSLTD